MNPKRYLKIFIALLIMFLVFTEGCKKEDLLSDYFNPDITYGNMTDQEGNSYKTVVIGNQVWMAENLRTVHYRNGDAITHVQVMDEWGHLVTEGYSNYDDNENNVKKYGRLYNCYAATDSRNIAPEGWHVPTDDDWCTLITHLDSLMDCFNFTNSAIVIPSLMASDGWQINNGSNITGFTALPGGYRSMEGYFNAAGEAGHWWSSTLRSDNRMADAFYLASGTFWGGMLTYEYLKFGFSIRCVKD